MTEHRPDLLAGLSRRQRLRRERDDAAYLANHKEVDRRADPEALKVVGNTFAGTKIFSVEQFKPYDPAETPDFVICARLDLDHPLYYADNLFADCADCGCDLQVRPRSPIATRLCVCCAARRVRESPDG